VSTRMGRMDALCIAFMLAAYYAYRGSRERKRDGPALFAAGALTALACMTHFVAFGFLGAILVLLAFDRSRFVPRAATYAAGGLCFAALWAAVGLSEGRGYFDALLHHGAMRSAGGSLPQRVAGEAERWGVDALRAPVLFATYVTAVVSAARGRSSADEFGRELMIVSVAMLTFNALVMSKESGYYPLHVAAFLTLFAAHWSANAYGEGGRPRALATVLVAGAILAFVPSVLIPRVVAATVQREARDYDAVARELDVVIPLGTRTWAVSEAWYALAGTDRSVRTPSLDYNPHPVPPSTTMQSRVRRARFASSDSLRLPESGGRCRLCSVERLPRLTINSSFTARFIDLTGHPPRAEARPRRIHERLGKGPRAPIHPSKLLI
jgi:hypothetical protein